MTVGRPGSHASAWWPAGEGGRRAMYATFVQQHAFDHVGPGQANDVLFATSGGGIHDDRGTAAS